MSSIDAELKWGLRFFIKDIIDTKKLIHFYYAGDGHTQSQLIASQIAEFCKVPATFFLKGHSEYTTKLKGVVINNNRPDLLLKKVKGKVFKTFGFEEDIFRKPVQAMLVKMGYIKGGIKKIESPMIRSLLPFQDTPSSGGELFHWYNQWLNKRDLLAFLEIKGSIANYFITELCFCIFLRQTLDHKVISDASISSGYDLPLNKYDTVINILKYKRDYVEMEAQRIGEYICYGSMSYRVPNTIVFHDPIDQVILSLIQHEVIEARMYTLEQPFYDMLYKLGFQEARPNVYRSKFLLDGHKVIGYFGTYDKGKKITNDHLYKTVNPLGGKRTYMHCCRSKILAPPTDKIIKDALKVPNTSILTLVFDKPTGKEDFIEVVDFVWEDPFTGYFNSICPIYLVMYTNEGLKISHKFGKSKPESYDNEMVTLFRKAMVVSDVSILISKNSWENHSKIQYLLYIYLYSCNTHVLERFDIGPRFDTFMTSLMDIGLNVSILLYNQVKKIFATYQPNSKGDLKMGRMRHEMLISLGKDTLRVPNPNMDLKDALKLLVMNYPFEEVKGYITVSPLVDIERAKVMLVTANPALINNYINVPKLTLITPDNLTLIAEIKSKREGSFKYEVVDLKRTIFGVTRVEKMAIVRFVK
jgi:hypothetical protein